MDKEIIKNIETEFEQDAREASIEYQIAKRPRAIGGAAFADIVRKMNVNSDFVAGARFGIEWYKNKFQSILTQSSQ